MPAFRIFDPFEVFFNNQGEPLVGGQIRFYQAGTTTPKNVFGNKALTINNGATVDLDAAGRANVEIWGDGAYFVELYNALGVKLDDADDIEIPGGEGQTFPALVPDQFLTNDGTNLLWQAVRQVPDPSGSAGKVLGTDGTLLIWRSATATTPGVVTHQTVTAAASTTIDLSLGLSVTLNHAVDIATLAFVNIPGGSGVLSIRRVKDNSATARAIAWPASVKWPGGSAPTLTATANAIDEIALKFNPDGVFTGTHRLAFA